MNIHFAGGPPLSYYFDRDARIVAQARGESFEIPEERLAEVEQRLNVSPEQARAIKDQLAIKPNIAPQQ